MDLVRIGFLKRAHGLRGEVVLEGASLSADELRRIGDFQLRRAGEARALALDSVREAHDRMLVRFQGCSDRDQAEGLVPGELLAEKERLPDPGPEVAYTFQLIGLRVVEEDGRELGVVADVLRTGANPLYVVRGERELLIPGAPEVVRRVDLAGGRIVVSLPAGLEDL